MGQLMQKRSRRTLGMPLAVLMGGLLVGSAFAEVYPEDLAEMSAGALITQGTSSLSAMKYDDAVVYLEEYLLRMGDKESVRVKDMCQRVRLKLATVYSFIGQNNSDQPDAFTKSIENLNAYVSQLPMKRPREAYKLMTINYSQMHEYQQCIDAAKIALTEPAPKLLEEKEEKLDLDNMSKDDLGGLTKRQMKRYMELEAEAKAAGNADSQDDLASKEKPELPYTTADKILINTLMADAAFNLEQWDGCISGYRYIYDNEVEPERKGYAVQQLVKSWVELKQYDQITKFANEISKTEDRFDVRVNLALMKAADVLLQNDQRDNAMMLYRMVLPRVQLIAHQEKRINDIRADVGLPDVQITVVTNTEGAKETILGYRESNLAAIFEAQEQAGTLPDKPEELVVLEQNVIAVADMASYENTVLYRIGQVSSMAGRPWEAVTALDAVADLDDETLSERAFADALMVYVTPLKEYDLVLERSAAYLEDHKEGVLPRMVAHARMSAFQATENWQAIKDMKPMVENFFPSDDKSIRRFECELYYLMAISDLMLLNYKEAQAGFEYVLDEFKPSHQRENASYWHGMSTLFLQKYDEALGELIAFEKSFPKSRYLASVIHHQGVCLFATDRAEEAMPKYTQVIENYPDSRVYPDSCSMRGDLFASDGKLDLAKKDYEEAIRTANNVKQDSYATFRMTAMFELEKRYDEILEAVRQYLKRNGEEADVAKAAYWTGKTKLAKGDKAGAVEEYRRAIVTYGGDVQQDGVDMIITELVKVSKDLEDAEMAELKDKVLRTIQSAEAADTLKLRLRVLLAEIEGNTLELGKQLITDVKDLSNAPPPVLSVICTASFDAGDYSRAEEILTIFKTKFEDSDFMGAAYKLRGYDLFEQQNWDEALKVIKDTQEQYGTSTDAVWAMMMKGEIKLKQKDFAAARETFRKILLERSWRGEPYAEANFNLGITEEQAGELATAFGWYQRTYVQYKGYNGGQWAADAYLASARVLGAMGRENDRRNTYRAMLFDKYVNKLSQAEEAKAYLGAAEVAEIDTLISEGVQTNIAVSVEAEVAQK